MKTRKINLDRTPIESEYVQSKQNFDHVLSNYKAIKPTLWKNPWFYGPIGLASIALVVALSIGGNENEPSKAVTEIPVVEFPEDTKCIHPILEKEDVAFEVFQVDPLNDEKLQLKSGTTIEIPKGSLEAKKTEENVTVKVREFKTKAESFVAGIPMDYGSDKAFESAGMIEIRGFQDGKTVVISPEKPIEISLSLSQNSNGFGFWKLNEDSKEWIKYPTIVSDFENKGIDNTTKISNFKKNKVDEEIIQINTKIDQLEEPQKSDYMLANKGGQVFDIDFKPSDYPELEKLKGVEFEVDSKVKYDKNFTKKTWNTVDLTKSGNQYLVKFTNAKEEIQLPVRPVLTGARKEKAEIEFQKVFDTYNETKNELISEKEKLEKSKKEQQAKFDQIVHDAKQMMKADSKKEELNAIKKIDFRLLAWGVYNCDKPISYPKPLAKELAFLYENNADINLSAIYVFDGDKNVRYSFGEATRHSLTEFGFNLKHKTTLIAIDKEGEISYVKDVDSQNLDLGRIKFKRIQEKDVNLNYIEKLINESTLDT
ncbi:MAG: hypothetical protein HYR91_07135 [Flavobacteriia bacterium]|nr:hypothetical protein [Flavobacteriia bacterium]